MTVSLYFMNLLEVLKGLAVTSLICIAFTLVLFGPAVIGGFTNSSRWAIGLYLAEFVLFILALPVIM